MSQITVKAAPGVRVPREENARRYITDDTEVQVESTSAYYLRQISAGDLLIVAPGKVSSSSVGTKTKTEVSDGQS
ncbi:hypothetical protein [Dickeya undicola]|uniref:DUF2635 domain-containing protein n=1 Tax=Dickeya undicola TaxID=1577887 RepID=A0A3N0G092_9GAMM|nr:hypothetical protein [Dickeya undicola]RNM05863.1 hypothetical protein EF878_11545 [Dickeya undicola]